MTRLIYIIFILLFFSNINAYSQQSRLKSRLTTCLGRKEKQMNVEKNKVVSIDYLQLLIQPLYINGLFTKAGMLKSLSCAINKGCGGAFIFGDHKTWKPYLVAW